MSAEDSDDGRGTRPAKKLGVAAYTFTSASTGPIGLERARAVLVEFDTAFPNRLIYDRTQVEQTPEATTISVEYLTNDQDPVSLWQKFSEIARKHGL